MAWEKWGGDGQHDIETRIGQGCRIEGKLVFQGDLRVDGEIIGDVQADPAHAGCLFLSAQGRIKGNVRVSAVVVGGEVLEVNNLRTSIQKNRHVPVFYFVVVWYAHAKTIDMIYR